MTGEAPKHPGCIDQSGHRKNLPLTTRKALDWDLIGRMASRMISVTDIAASTGVSPDTLRRAYLRDFGEPLQDFVAKQRATGRASLSNAQFMRAMSKLSDSALAEIIAAGDATDKVARERQDEDQSSD